MTYRTKLSASAQAWRYIQDNQLKEKMCRPRRENERERVESQSESLGGPETTKDLKEDFQPEVW